MIKGTTLTLKTADLQKHDAERMKRQAVKTTVLMKYLYMECVLKTQQ